MNTSLFTLLKQLRCNLTCQSYGFVDMILLTKPLMRLIPYSHGGEHPEGKPSRRSAAVVLCTCIYHRYSCSLIYGPRVDQGCAVH